MNIKANRIGSGKIRSRSPTRYDNNKTNNKQISFAQLSRPTSRSGSTKKGLFGISIQKIKLKQQSKIKQISPYFLFSGSTQPTKAKSPCKLLSLKSHSSLKRPKSPLKSPKISLFPKRQQQIILATKHQNSKVNFSNLIKSSSSINKIYNENNKQNNSHFLNKLISHSKKQNKQQILQNSSKQSITENIKINEQHLQLLTNTSISSLQDKVNISMTQSLMKLDMNPF